jgi:hypothetical protein
MVVIECIVCVFVLSEVKTLDNAVVSRQEK